MAKQTQPIGIELAKRNLVHRIIDINRALDYQKNILIKS